MRDLFFRLGLVACLAAPAAAIAHHSHAMFDIEKYETVEGTVKAFNFANPHVYLFLLVKKPDGSVGDFPVEMSYVQNMNSQGITGTTFKPGDKVTVTVNPLRTGQPGGSYTGAVDAQGQKHGRYGPREGGRERGGGGGG